MTAQSLMDTGDEYWARLIREEHGVLHRREIPPEYLRQARRELDARRWRRLGHGVVVTHNGPLDHEQELRAALKASPSGSVLSGLTAAEIDGFAGFPTQRVHITQPCGTRSARLAGVDVHYSRFLTSEDVHPLRSPRRTRLPRSLLDAATWHEHERVARAIVLAGVQQGLVSPGKLTEALGRRGPCRRHALLVETIADALGGVASLPEAEFAEIVRRYELPAPTRQSVLRRADGRYYLDADWPEFDLAAEVDGRPHMDVEHWDADLDRANEVVIDRRTLLRFTSFAVRRRAPSVGSTLVRALTARGWEGR